MQVRRRTHYTYKTDQLYLDLYLRSLVTAVEVYDAQQDTQEANDLLIAKSTYEYDNYGHFGGWIETYGLIPTTYPPGYQVTPGRSARGDVTGTTEWTDIQSGSVIQHFAAYDLFGNVIKAQVSCCQEKDSTLTQNTYWSQTETEMSGDPNGTHLATSTDYNFNTSLPVSATDAGGLTTSYAYNGALDLTNVNLPTGAAAALGYDYAHLSRTSTVTYTDGADEFGNPITKTITTSEQDDGWGRVIQSVDRNGGQVNTTYDALGRVISRTNPFPAGGTPGSATTFQYDALGRATITTLPDGNTVQKSYSGATVTATDQVGRKIKREVDGLGRLVKVTEQDASTGALTQETTYAYNLLDKLIGVNQGGQTRAFKYDAIGRLLYERIPEQTATINDGAGGMWSCKYTYNEWSGVATKQDARGVITTFTYDPVHRLTQKSYNTSAAPGVAVTSAINYLYDIQFPGTLYSVGGSNYGDYSESYVYDNAHQLASVTRSNQLNTSYQYNGAGQMTKMTYPSGNIVDVSYDARGRLSGESSENGGGAGITGYNIAGQVTGMTYGYGIIESYGYDANRLQLTTQTATKSGNLLMNLNYYYQASAGQMGTGTTAGNAGQLMAINNNSTINGTTESAMYTYDDLGRLVTSNQTSNGVTAQRRFDYDRWGNRTAAYDATTGGNQIQSVSLEQSGGVPTNRIQSVSGARTNVALVANGATASASSTYGPGYSASSVINGDRRGTNWGADGGWNDATGDYPDWLQVNFSGSKTINEIDVFTLQDTYWNPSEPTEDMNFSQYGIVDYQVQYWNGSSWQTVPGGSVTGNNKVWRKFTFSSITTDKIRVYITNALATFSRLTEVEAYQSAAVSYSYDAAGNVTNDGAHSYQYDAENRLVKVDNGATAQYWYDHQNRRVKKVSGGYITLYVWVGSQVIAEHDGTVNPNQPYGSTPYGVMSAQVDYLYVGSRLLMSKHYTPNCVYQYGYPTICHPTWTDRYYLSDRLSARLVLDSSGNVIGRQGTLPFGEDFAESGTQEKHHLTSYERDGESGTDYAVNRQYSQGVGRFMRVDPVSGDPLGPQSLNRYSYSGNEPMNRRDPLGLTTVCFVDDQNVLAPGGFGPAAATCFDVDDDDSDPGKDPGAGGSADYFAPLKKKQEQALENALKSLIDRLKNGTLSDKCKTNVIDKLTKELGFDPGAFASYLDQGAKFYDGTKSSALISGNITTPQAFRAGRGSVFLGDTIAEHFRNSPGTNAMTSITSSTLLIFFRPDTIDTSNSGVNGRNLSLLFHEALHGFTGKVDADLGKALLGPDWNGPSGEISDYIKQNCF